MNRILRVVVLLVAVGASACATLSPQQQARAQAIAEAARPTQLDCDRADACATPSPLHQLGVQAIAQSKPGVPRHYALILDGGQDAMLARISLLRSATTSIDLQTYIFDEDDAGQLFLGELLAAARRGVRVRLLVDQLSALKRVDTLAALAGVHANFSLRLYNPVLHRARLGYGRYVFAAACCWRQLNQRMHTKLLLVDGVAGITGGRNYQDDYYDWDDGFNFRDRDILVAGPVASEMAANFDAFWNDTRTVPPARLVDVGRMLLKDGVLPLAPPKYGNPQRVEEMLREAGDPAMAAALAAAALPVAGVSYIADLPKKHREDRKQVPTPATIELQALIESAQQQVLLQTPYLVLSDVAQELFREMHHRPNPPRVIVSTNSLAATDSFITYALSYKYKRRYLRDFGFEIHEFKPFPGNAPIDLAATGAELPPAPSDEELALARQQLLAARSRRGSNPAGYRRPLQAEYTALRFARRRANERVPLERAGVRIGLHAKSLVVDERVGVIGTHNFDPRGDHYNTESAVVIQDPAFAQALARSIDRDLAPANSWVIARRPGTPVFSGLEFQLAKLSERMPIFDLWPVRYATTFEFVPGEACPQPLSPFDPGFRDCYREIGDFPQVAIGMKSILTRIFTAFGAGLAPIL